MINRKAILFLLLAITILNSSSGQISISGSPNPNIINLKSLNQCPAGNYTYGLNTHTGEVLCRSDQLGSGSGSGGNVSSVSSANGYIAASPTTGDVVLTFSGTNLNNTIARYNVTGPFDYNQSSSFSYNHTQIILYNNQTLQGKVSINATAGNTPLSIRGSQAGGLMDKYLKIYDGNTEIFWLGKAVFGTYSGIIQPNPAGNIFFGIVNDDLSYVGSGVVVSGIDLGLNRVTGATTTFTENLTGFAQFDLNKNFNLNNNLTANKAELQLLNVSINATIPHFNVNNSNFTLRVNHTNTNGKAIRVDMGIVSEFTALSTDTAYIRIILNHETQTSPQYIQLCGSQAYPRINHIEYHICVFDVPVGYNYSVYPITVNAGTVALKEVHIVDE